MTQVRLVPTFGKIEWVQKFEPKPLIFQRFRGLKFCTHFFPGNGKLYIIKNFSSEKMYVLARGRLKKWWVQWVQWVQVSIILYFSMVLAVPTLYPLLETVRKSGYKAERSDFARNHTMNTLTTCCASIFRTNRILHEMTSSRSRSSPCTFCQQSKKSRGRNLRKRTSQ